MRESGVIIGLHLVSTQNHSVLHRTLYIAVHDEMMLQVRRQMAAWWARAGAAAAHHQLWKLMLARQRTEKSGSGFRIGVDNEA
jgi:hypothetical protein